jgi:hypothetical protein
LYKVIRKVESKLDKPEKKYVDWFLINLGNWLNEN